MRKRSERDLVPRNGHTLMVGIGARISGCSSQKELSNEDQVDHGKQLVIEEFDYQGPVQYRVISTKGKGEAIDRPELEEIENAYNSDELDLFIWEDLARLVRGQAQPPTESDVHALADAWFLGHLAELKSRARGALYRMQADPREEAMAEVLATVFESCLNAARRGALDRVTPYHAVMYAARRHRCGRRFAGSSSCDVMGEVTQVKGQVAVQSLFDPARDEAGHRRPANVLPLAEVISDRREQSPLERTQGVHRLPANPSRGEGEPQSEKGVPPSGGRSWLGQRPENRQGDRRDSWTRVSPKGRIGRSAASS
jgi:hypothetical protein